jgi:hypothetical protein
MDRRNEHGVALVITLFLMAALSALAVSLMFLSQTETSASRNYKTMSQARYAGEAGVHKAMNYLMSDAYVNTLPATYGSLTTGVYPVQWNGADVTLPSPTSGTATYPNVGNVRANFLALFSGTANDLPAGSTNLKYTATAKLLSMQPVNVYGSNTKYIQTWQITATGTVQGPLPATVDVTAILERDIAPAQTYAVFATGNGCGAITMGGDATTDSYDSRSLGGSAPTAFDDFGGGVGTNGNLSIAGHVVVKGNLDTPRTGVGDCHSGTPTALSTSGSSATVTGSIVPLPQERVYETPVVPTGVPTTPIEIDDDAVWCDAFKAANITSVASCTVGSSHSVVVTLINDTPLALGNVTLGSQVNLTINAGAGGVANVNVNSLSVGAQGKITVGAGTAIVMNVVGTGVATPINLSGGGFVNTSYDASLFRIIYAGTGQVELIGGGGAAISVYAPNASVRLNGNQAIYGSVLSKTYTNAGTGNIHYDRALASKFFTLGNWVMSSFSWKKY